MSKRDEFFKMVEEAGDLPSSGMASCRPVVTCLQCGGQGWINRRSPWSVSKATFRPIECPSCNGLGRVEVSK